MRSDWRTDDAHPRASHGRFIRNAQLTRLLQAQFHSLGLGSLDRILTEVGLVPRRILAGAASASWRRSPTSTRAAYVLAAGLHAVTFRKLVLSPGILLVAQKPA